MNIKQMEAKLKKLKKQAARLDKEIYELDGKLWNAKVAAVKPENMCRRQWRLEAGCYCALEKGHEGICQGMAPPLPEPPPKYRKVKYHWLPRGVDFSESNMDGVVPCEYCGWPVADYENSWFHIVGRFGEGPKGCDDAAPIKTKKATA